MFPSFVSNLIWGSSSNDGTDDSIQQQHEEDLTVSEEQGDWLVIDYTSTGDNDSVASETSWIVSPSPRFRSSSATSSLKGHSMENLLLECSPSLYNHHQMEDNIKNKELVLYDKSKRQVAIRNQNRQLVLYRKRNQLELAARMGIPLTKPVKPSSEPVPQPTVPKLTKKSTRKHNDNNIRVTRGKKSFKIHQCGVKAGRRRN